MPYELSSLIYFVAIADSFMLLLRHYFATGHITLLILNAQITSLRHYAMMSISVCC